MVRQYNFKVDWLLLFLILLPTFYITGQETRLNQMMFFYYSIIAMLGVFHVNRYVGIMLLYCLFHSIFINSGEFAELVLQQVFLGSLLYQFIVLFSSKKDIKKYLWAILGLLIFNILWIPLQMANVDPVWNIVNPQHQSVMSEFPGWFNLPAFLGNYAAVALPLALSMFWPVMVFVALGLWFSKSTFSIVAGYVACLVFFWFRKRIIFWILLIVLGIGTVAYVNNDLKSGQFFRRIGVWQKITKTAFHRQFIGHGLGSYGRDWIFVETTPEHNYFVARNLMGVLAIAHDYAARMGRADLVELVKGMALKVKNGEAVDVNDISRRFQEVKIPEMGGNMDIMLWSEAHNEFLQTFFDIGLFGIAIIMFFITDIFRRFWRFGRKDIYLIGLFSSFIAILIVSAGHFPFHVARLAGPFIVIIAFLDSALRGMQKISEDVI